MNFFVTNDDGILSPGIIGLVRAISAHGDCYVVAPESERSASSHSISILKEVYVSEIDFEGASRAFSCSGTPVDCVKIGLEVLRKRGIKIDRLFSGINMGGNIGTDTLYSGTVSAAMEGLLNGIPSVAVSIDAGKNYSFEPAMGAAEKFAAAESLPSKLININVPNIPDSEIKGFRVCPLGLREYREWFVEKKISEDRLSAEYSGKPIAHANISPTSDVHFVLGGYISVTPMQYDLTAHDEIDAVN
jgi:5'-nucleotidase